ncbi:MEDS domain-containing protein [Amycolatopsis sacchari]|uniref:MEDS domain-containing protein n=1 Tax=Amycolatopsis sacchari TaxID=115433 RepID=UPI003D70C6D0
MRRVGAVASARGLAAHDHVCWSYSDRAGFRSVVREFLADGLAAGQRVHYVTTEHDDFTEGLEGVQVSLVHESYDARVLDPAVQVRGYAAAAEAALRDGYTGFRVAADVTELVRTPEGFAAFARYEHLVDRMISARPFTGLCGYDRGAVPDDVLTQLAALHPLSNSEPPFRLYASGSDGVALAGELDLTGRALLPLALAHADLRPERRCLYVEARAVEFVDHRALVALAEHARDRGFAEVVLRSRSRCPARLVELLGLDGIRVEVAR